MAVALQHTEKRETYVIGVYNTNAQAIKAAQESLEAQETAWTEVQSNHGHLVWESPK